MRLAGLPPAPQDVTPAEGLPSGRSLMTQVDAYDFQVAPRVTERGTVLLTS